MFGKLTSESSQAAVKCKLWRKRHLSLGFITGANFLTELTDEIALSACAWHIDAIQGSVGWLGRCKPVTTSVAGLTFGGRT